MNLRRLSPLFPMVLAACTVGPDYHPSSASQLGVPASWQTPADSSAEDLSQWWQKFDDPVLTRLVDRAVTGNLDIAQAAARLRQAREALVQAKANQVPNLGASAGIRETYDISGQSTADRSVTNYTADRKSVV